MQGPPPGNQRHAAQIVSCPNCGAPVDTARFAGAFPCTYCGKVINVSCPRPEQDMRRLEPVRLPEPKTMLLPPLLMVAVMAALVVAALAVTVVTRFAFQRSSTRQVRATSAKSVEPGVAAARLSELTMDRTPQQLAVWAGKNAAETNGDRLELKLRDSRFASLAFSWADPQATHVERVTLTAREPIVDGDRVLQTATSVFGRRFVKDPGGGYSYEANGESYTVKDRQLVIHARATAHPNWQRQLAALWEVARATVLEQPVRLGADVRRDWLGTGYTLRSLLAINPAVDIDASRAHLGGLFPGISWSEAAGELRYRLPLDHPWFGEVSFGWPNEKGGRLKNVSFRPPPGKSAFPNQREIRDCLARKLGNPEDRETNHLAGEFAYFWGKHFPKVYLNLHSSMLWLQFQNSAGIPPITLAGTIGALDACVPGPS